MNMDDSQWTVMTTPEEAARILLARVPGVTKVEAETIPITYVMTYTESHQAREATYVVEEELMKNFPGVHWDFWGGMAERGE